jgi:arsenate reductase-like glutaredoxin family protein
MSCERADELLGKLGWTAREVVDARKQKLAPKDLPALFAKADKIVVCRGQQSEELRFAARTPTLAELDATLGQTGNLRAPTIRIGKTYYVGFSEPAWRVLLGAK